MLTVSCPSCGEKGKIPDGFVGNRLKCRKCGTGFQVTAPAAKPVAAPSPSVREAQGDEIVVEGLDDSAWATTGVPIIASRTDPSAAATQDIAHHHEHDTAAIKQYKLLTPRDRYFEGKFDLARLEEALNHFARDGWVVRGMATPHVTSFQGEKEELVVLLER